MTNFFKKNSSYILIGITFICIYLLIHARPLTTPNSINSDGYGYYAYLPSILIHNQFAIANPTQFAPDQPILDYPTFIYHPEANSYLNKYPPGTAILLLPSFIVAVLLSFLLQLPIDGYNPVFQHTIGITTSLFATSGIYFMYQIANRVTNTTTAKLSIIAIIAGTSFTTYTVYAPTFSHIYSLALTSAFIYLTLSPNSRSSRKQLSILGILWGLLTLTRNTNILIILFWIIYQLFQQGKYQPSLSNLKLIIKPLAIISIIAIPIITIQPTYQYLSVEAIPILSYSQEGFNWMDPAWYGVLFSPRRGLFFWAPILYLCLISLTQILKPPRWAIPSAIYIAIQTYIIASWHQWWFGDSYGHRAFIDLYPFFILFLAQGFQKMWKKRPTQIAAISFLIICIVINTILTIQWWIGNLYHDNTFTHNVIRALLFWR